jgi:hypothetical protein
MTRRQWIGSAGVLFGAVMLAGVFSSGTTPDNGGSGAVQRYTEYWADSSHQDKAALGSVLLTYACVLLALFAAGLRSLLVGGGLARVVLAGGTAAAATMAVASTLLNGVGIAAAESGYEADGNHALLLEGLGYYAMATAMMLAAAMAVAFGLANRTERVVPQWTLVLGGLLGLIALGTIFVAWVGFILLPVWAIVIGLCLLVTRGAVTEDVVV